VTKTVALFAPIAIGVSMSLLAAPSDPPEHGLGLPQELRLYRDWPQLLRSPYQVPVQLWIRCMAPTAADWEKARRTYGPHTERYIRVYANAAAATAASSENARHFPVGAVLAKEKLLGSPHGSVEGVAFMTKRPKAAFPETNGWEFSYFPDSSDMRRTHESCASCHRSAASTDFVFGKYPR